LEELPENIQNPNEFLFMFLKKLYIWELQGGDECKLEILSN